MSSKTGIEWTDSTWNPLRGCSRVSEGCRNCYAEKVAYRFSAPGQPYEGLAILKNGHASWTGKVTLVEKHLPDPLKWGPVIEHRAGCHLPGAFVRGRRVGLCKCPARPRRIFVNSMSDLFHESVPDEWIDQIFAVMALCPQHVFQVLTKRPERMRDYLTANGRTSIVYNAATPLIGGDFSKMPDGMAHHRSSGDSWWPLPNVWLGVSVENQKAADERIPLLRQTPAAVRFLSCEPLLGDLTLDDLWGAVSSTGSILDAKPEIDWVICGGESGPGARPMHPDWARSLRDGCLDAGVPFFFKQWGEWGPCENGEITPNPEDWDTPPEIHEFDDADRPRCAQERVYRVGKRTTGHFLDGREHHEFPEVTR